MFIKKGKKLIAFLLTLIMTVSSFSLLAYSEETSDLNSEVIESDESIELIDELLSNLFPAESDNLLTDDLNAPLLHGSSDDVVINFNENVSLSGDLSGSISGGYLPVNLSFYQGNANTNYPATVELVQDEKTGTGYGLSVALDPLGPDGNGPTNINTSTAYLNVPLSSLMDGKNYFAVEMTVKFSVPKGMAGPALHTAIGGGQTRLSSHLAPQNAPGGDWTNWIRCPLLANPENNVFGISPFYSSANDNIYTWVKLRHEWNGADSKVIIQSPVYTNPSLTETLLRQQIKQTVANVTIDHEYGILTISGLGPMDFQNNNTSKNILFEITSHRGRGGSLMVESIVFTEKPFIYSSDFLNNFGTGTYEIEDGGGDPVDPGNSDDIVINFDENVSVSGGNITGGDLPVSLGYRQGNANTNYPATVELVQEEEAETGYGLSVTLDPNGQSGLSGPGDINTSTAYVTVPLSSLAKNRSFIAIETTLKFSVPKGLSGPALHTHMGSSYDTNRLSSQLASPKPPGGGGNNWFRSPETSKTNENQNVQFLVSPYYANEDDSYTWIKLRHEYSETDSKIIIQSPVYTDTSIIPSLANMPNYPTTASIAIDHENGVLTISGLGKIDFQSGSQSISFEISSHRGRGGSVLFESILITEKEFDPEWDFNGSKYDPSDPGEFSDDPFPEPPSDPFGLMPVGNHPRLLVREADLPGLKEKITNPKTSGYFSALKIQANQTSNFSLSQSFTGTSNQDTTVLTRIKAKAFMYLMGEGEQYGIDAVAMMSQYFETFKYQVGLEAYNRGMLCAEILYTGSLVYDWCYDLLGNADKRFFIHHLTEYAKLQEFGYPFSESSVVGSHTSSRNIVYEGMSFAIAVYDEFPEPYLGTAWKSNTALGYDARTSGMYLWLNRYIPSINLMAEQMGTNLQGTVYGVPKVNRYSHTNAIVYNMQDQESRVSYMTEENLNVMRSYIYYVRPDGQSLRFGDMYSYNQPEQAQSVLYLNAVFDDPVLNDYLDFLGRGFGGLELDAFIFTNIDVDKEPIENLPLSIYNPLGEIVARTGWNIGNNSADMLVDMRIKEMTINNHDHLDHGTFQIYYKGGLAIDRGIYEGTGGGYGSPHDYNWNKKSISHNSLLIRDPSGVNTTAGIASGANVTNDGGQIFPGRGTDPQEVVLDNNGKITASNYLDWERGEVLAHQIGSEPNDNSPDFSYIKGDINELYPNRASRVNRSMVTLNFFDEIYPGALIVFDNITSTNADYEKYYLLHSTFEPVVSGNTTTISRKDNNYNGQLINTTLLPSDATIEKIVGMDVFGQTFNASDSREGDISAEDFSWRIQVSPAEKNINDVFLNVLQVSDAGTTPLPVEQIGSVNDEVVGVKIYDRSVIFSTSGSLLETSFTIPATAGNDRIKYLVTDMTEGKWVVRNSAGNIVDVINVTEEGQCGYFTADSSEAYTLIPDPDAAEVNRPTWTNGAVTTSNVTESSVTLHWSGSSEDTIGYNIYVNNVLFKTVMGKDTNSVTLTGLSGGTKKFTIEAFNSEGFISNTGPSVIEDITEKFTISGTVILDYANRPVKGAIVNAYRTLGGNVVGSTVTDNSGSYTLTNIPAGFYYIEIKAAGAETKVESVTITDSDVSGHDYLLLPVLDSKDFILSVSEYAFIDPASAITNLFDGIVSDAPYWSSYPYDPASGSTAVDWSKEAYGIIDLGEVRMVAGVDLMPRVSYSTEPRGPKVAIRVSEDGENFTTLIPDPDSGLTYWQIGQGLEWKLGRFDEPIKARYIHIVIYGQGSGLGTYDHWCSIRQARIIGYEVESTTEVTVISATPSASVEKLTGNKNKLTVTVTEKLSDGGINVIENTFSINNNSAGIYQVGYYKVYVDTKGNTQIRACYIIE